MRPDEEASIEARVDAVLFTFALLTISAIGWCSL